MRNFVVVFVTASSREEAEEIVGRFNSYEVPELTAVPLAAISGRYRSYMEGFFRESR